MKHCCSADSGSGTEGGESHWLSEMAANHLGLKCLLRLLEDESPVCPELMGSNIAAGGSVVYSCVF